MLGYTVVGIIVNEGKFRPFVIDGTEVGILLDIAKKTIQNELGANGDVGASSLSRAIESPTVVRALPAAIKKVWWTITDPTQTPDQPEQQSSWSR